MSRDKRVGASSTGPPNIPEWTAWSKHANLESAVHQAAKAGSQGGHAHLPVAGVGHHDHIGPQKFLVLFKERPEGRRAGFFLALKEEGHAQAKIVPQDLRHRTVSRKVGHDACFIVSCTAAIQPAFPLFGDERFRIPEASVARRLHVMVRVQQDGGLALCGRTAGDDGRTTGGAVSFIAAKDPDVLHAGLLNQGGNGVGAPIQFLGIKACPRNPE
jgi:hypothetical protein